MRFGVGCGGNEGAKADSSSLTIGLGASEQRSDIQILSPRRRDFWERIDDNMVCDIQRDTES